MACHPDAASTLFRRWQTWVQRAHRNGRTCSSFRKCRNCLCESVERQTYKSESRGNVPQEQASLLAHATGAPVLLLHLHSA